MKIIQFILLIWPFCLLTAKEPSCKNNPLYCPWVVCYSGKVKASEYKPYNPIVLDSHHHPPLTLLKNKEIYGYISIGEVSNERPYFEEVKEMGLLLEENPNWPGSYYVDLRKEEWSRLVLDRLIPDILTQGFTGLFLDTLDNPIYLEQQNPEKYEGMISAAEQLVQLMRIYFPEVKIMLNRAYRLVDEVGSSITSLLAESLYTSYNFATKEYYLQPEEQYNQQVKQLKRIQKQFPKLEIFSLDYWYPEETAKIKEIYRLERENGFKPYVSTVALNKIYPEPK